jgi:cytoskeletal protein CcmA (bactofilin family)
MLKDQKSASEAEPQRPSRPAAGNSASHISSDLQVEGDLKSTGNIRIEGRVKGHVHAQAVDITPGAFVDGSVKAQTVQVGGKVKGEVEAQRVMIQQTGEMLGDVIYENLEVESGSRFEGACKPKGSTPTQKQDTGDTPKVA